MPRRKPPRVRPVASLADLQPDARNANRGTDRGRAVVRSSLQDLGAGRSIVVDAQGRVIAGNKTVEAARETDGDELVVVQRRDLDLSERGGRARKLAYADNRASELGLAWDAALIADDLADEPDLLAGLWDDDEIAALTRGLDIERPGGGPAAPRMADRFLVPPFSVLDARQGYWQDRKRAWLAMGIQSELGRPQALLGLPAVSEIGRYRASLGRQGLRGDQSARENPGVQTAPVIRAGTSIFDPVLCEVVYRWFSPPDGLVLDPFAGGSVRGIVAGALGRRYEGIELRAEQIAANEAQAETMGIQPRPRWIEGDARQKLTEPGEPCDLVFSCPPYHDLERYSDDPRDLSNLPWPEFMRAYREIIAAAMARLADDRFAVFVVGDIRDNRGNYRNFVSETISAFLATGASLYNEAILVTVVGSLAYRAGQQMVAACKLGKTHQNVLVFAKGSGARAAEACGPIEVADIDAMVEAAAEGDL